MILVTFHDQEISITVWLLMNRELQEITHKKNNDTSIALRPQQLFYDMNALYQLGSYIPGTCWTN